MRFFTYFLFSLAACAVLIPHTSSAREWWVSTRGDDENLGTQKLPWGTIQHAAEEAQPGDTVMVAPGVYNEQVYIEVEGNASEGPITFQAATEEGGDPVVISAEGLDDDNIIYIEDKSYLRIIGFELRDLQTKDGSGIRFEGAGTHLEFRDNHIHHIKGKNAMGITIYASDEDTPVSALIIDGNHVHDCDAAPSEALTLNGNVDGFEVTNNHVHDVDGIAIDFIGGEQSINGDPSKVTRNGLCKGNRVARARSSYEGGWGAAIYVDGGRDIEISENQVTESDLGIEIGAENEGIIAQNITVRGNFIHHNDKAGIVFGGYGKKAGRVQKCLFEANFLYSNTQHKKAQAEVWIQWASDNVVKGNTVQGDGLTPLLAAEADDHDNTLTENIWYFEEPEMAPATPGVPARKPKPMWHWWGETYKTLAAFQSGTGKGEGSKFEKVKLVLPETAE